MLQTGQRGSVEVIALMRSNVKIKDKTENKEETESGDLKVKLGETGGIRIRLLAGLNRRFPNEHLLEDKNEITINNKLADRADKTAILRIASAAKKAWSNSPPMIELEPPVAKRVLQERGQSVGKLLASLDSLPTIKLITKETSALKTEIDNKYGKSCRDHRPLSQQFLNMTTSEMNIKLTELEIDEYLYQTRTQCGKEKKNLRASPVKHLKAKRSATEYLLQHYNNTGSYPTITLANGFGTKTFTWNPKFGKHSL